MKHLQSSSGQLIILVAVIIGWAFSLIEFYAEHVAVAQPIADAGWGALLAIMQLDFGRGGAPTAQ